MLNGNHYQIVLRRFENMHPSKPHKFYRGCAEIE